MSNYITLNEYCYHYILSFNTGQMDNLMCPGVQPRRMQSYTHIIYNINYTYKYHVARPFVQGVIDINYMHSMYTHQPK